MGDAHAGHNHGLKCAADDTYTQYIESNREKIKEKCSQLTDCINKLLEEESAIVVLKGENISLNKTCGLVYKPENGNYTTLRGKCSATEREEIRSDLEDNLSEQLDRNRTWKFVNQCLKNTYGETQRTNRVEEICKLARNKREICNNATTHRLVQNFFNREIQNLQCKCNLLTSTTPAPGMDSEEMSIGGIVGIGIACFLILIIIFCIIFFCYRRKHQAKLRNNPNVVYMAAPGSEVPIYQELYDDKNFGRPPPTLPDRYTKHSTLSQDDAGYLEPVMAGMKYRPTPPIPGQASNPGYESPPRYSQYEREASTAEEDEAAGYIKPLPDAGIPSTAGGDMQPVSGGYEEISGSRSSIPLEDAPAPAGPVPAKRSRKEESKKEESAYFELENRNSKDERSTV